MFYFGVDYYPEHWPKERWPVDASLMAGAGINLVRLAEFAWSRMEPREGEVEFDWLDRAISILASHDIRVVLGTPSASPPPWLMSQHPDAFRVDSDGRRVTYGNRREYCPNSPAYHDHSRRIVSLMARHYADHPAVIGWQVDNEFGDRCYCPVCGRAFQDWLQRRYGTLDEVNERWGTVFWSHVYSDWEQIPVPARTGGPPNPGLALDFHRFMSDSYVAYEQLQVELLRQECPNHLVTHNLMGFGYDLIDYFDLARPLDVVAWDNYQRTQWGMDAEVDPTGGALGADTMRGLKGQNFWVMEQQAGSGGWEVVSVPPRPGELRLWAYQAIAHGADAIVFFRWRTARFGTEQYWYGLLDHDGHASRRYEEIRRMGAEIASIGSQIQGSTIRPAVAMILSYDSRFAFQVQQTNPTFSYPEHFQLVYRAFHRRHIPVDIVAPTADLSVYRLVLAPALHVVSTATAKNLKQYVEAGGVLVVTPLSGMKNEANTTVDGRFPGLLAELCGVEVEEHDSLGPGMRNSLRFSPPGQVARSPLPAAIWCDVLEPKGAEVVATYSDDYYAGKPAITLNCWGKGQVVYVGVLGDGRLYEELTGWFCDLAAVRPLLNVREDIEVTERWHGDRRLLFVLNHSGSEQPLALDGRYVDLLDGSRVREGIITLMPTDVLVLAQVWPE